MAGLHGEQYESLVAAVSHLDAALDALKEAHGVDDDVCTLHEMRNRLNARRVTLLGNGGSRPFYVSDLTR